MTDKKYATILIDLDNTLWDFHKNSREALNHIFFQHNLDKRGHTLPHFLETYHTHNDILWKAYREGRVEKSVLRWKRFYLTLKTLDIDSAELAHALDQEYLDTSKMKTGLIDGAIEILDYLSNKYAICLVTNGFNEVQFTKIRNSGLEKYFDNIITSEMAGHLKPDPRFYTYVFAHCKVISKNCIAIGDDPEADIDGARKAGIDQIFFSPNHHHTDIKATYTVKALREIRGIL